MQKKKVVNTTIFSHIPFAQSWSLTDHIHMFSMPYIYHSFLKMLTMFFEI